MNRSPTRLQLLRKLLADYWIAAFAILGKVAVVVFRPQMNE